MVFVIGILHPAYVLRGAWKHEPAQAALLRLAKELAEGEFDPIDINQPPPGALLDPTPEDCEQWLKGVDEQGVTCDIESAGPYITIIGFCRVCDLVPIVIPFRRRGGEPWDADWESLVARVEFADRVLGDSSIPVIFHNGQAFDVPRLEAVGFEVRGYTDDTLFLAGVGYPEMPKSLEYLGILFARVPGWKRLVRDDEVEDK